MTVLHYFFKKLAAKDFSQVELTDLAIEKGFEEIEIQDALKYLQAKNFQSDQRLAESIILAYYKQRGKQWIKEKYKQRKLDPELFDTAFENLTNQELLDDKNLNELKLTILRKYKINSFRNLDPKTLSKICNFLSYRGFNPFEVVNNWRLEI